MLFWTSENKNILSIEELRTLRIIQKKIENNKNSRKYISEINKRHKNWTEQKINNFFRKTS